MRALIAENARQGKIRLGASRYVDGRFLANDPASFAEHVSKGNTVHGFNRYAYANNNPYLFTDPDGRMGAVGNAWKTKTQVDAISRGEIDKAGLSSGTLRVISTGSDIVSKGALIVAAGGAMTGHMEVAVPAAKLSTAAGALSATTGLAADAIEGSGSGETIESASPMLAGGVTEAAAKTAKVAPGPAKAVAIGVEVVGTLVETASDVVESCQSNGTCSGE